LDLKVFAVNLFNKVVRLVWGLNDRYVAHLYLFVKVTLVTILAIV
jgi:hypothetical protein